MEIEIHAICDHTHQFNFIENDRLRAMAVSVRVTPRIALVTGLVGSGVSRRVFRLFHEAMTSIGYEEYISKERLPFAMGTVGAGYYSGFLTVRINELEPKIRGRSRERLTGEHY